MVLHVVMMMMMMEAAAAVVVVVLLLVRLSEKEQDEIAEEAEEADAVEDYSRHGAVTPWTARTRFCGEHQHHWRATCPGEDRVEEEEVSVSVSVVVAVAVGKIDTHLGYHLRLAITNIEHSMVYPGIFPGRGKVCVAVHQCRGERSRSRSRL
jgi:hypothetical protein